MSRWNIKNIILYSHANQKRVLEFAPQKVNIITGGSGTGKSAIIDLVDFCLGKKEAVIPIFVTDRTETVAVKWTNGTTEILVARRIPRPDLKLKDRMFVSFGSEIEIPEIKQDLENELSVDKGRKLLEHLFGFQDVKQESTDKADKKKRISIRQIVPYLFLSGEIILNKKTLLYGLDDQHAAKNIVASMPYFLGAVNEEEVEAERRMKQLRKAIEIEERKLEVSKRIQGDFSRKCKTLIAEAVQCGIYEIDVANETDHEKLLIILKEISQWKPTKIPLQNDDERQKLETKRAELIADRNRIKRKRKGAEQMEKAANGFSGVVEKQLSKVNVIDLFKTAAGDETCPVCSNHMNNVTPTAKAIKGAFNNLSNERSTVEAHRPSFAKYIEETDDQLLNLKTDIEDTEGKLRSLYREDENAGRLKDQNNRGTHIVGRVSYFLDSVEEIESFDTDKLNDYIESLEELEGAFSREQREEKIQFAENRISNLASEVFELLPRNEPCMEGNIQFISKEPKLLVFDRKHDRQLRFGEIGSDENYLSLHMALVFGLQRFFKDVKNSPVPGVVFVDQPSRPFFPDDDDSDIHEMAGTIGEEDADKASLRKHFDFMFKEVAKQAGLQVIVLEHANFKDDPRYVEATKYKWPKKGTERLIPSNWEMVETR